MNIIEAIEAIREGKYIIGYSEIWRFKNGRIERLDLSNSSTLWEIVDKDAWKIYNVDNIMELERLENLIMGTQNQIDVLGHELINLQQEYKNVLKNNLK